MTSTFAHLLRFTLQVRFVIKNFR